MKLMISLPFNGFNPLSVVLLDNASIHHTTRPVELIQSVGALVHYLPPYSPDLNPIEEMFQKLRHAYGRMMRPSKRWMKEVSLIL